MRHSSVAAAVSPGRARLAVTLFFLVSGFGFATWASRIPTIQQRLGLSEAQLGSVLLALPAGLMLTLPVTGLLLRHYSSRQVMLVGAVLYNVALALLGFATHTWQLVVLLFCFGSSRNLLNISVNAQSIGVQALYARSIIARFHGVWSVAGFAAAAVGAWVVAAGVAPQYHFLGTAVLLTGLALVFFPGSLALPPAPQAAKPAFALPDKTLLKFGLMAFASMACEGTMYDWGAIYFEKAVGTPHHVATMGFAGYMVAMTLGRFVGDGLASRFGVRALLRGSGLLMTAGLVLAALVPLPLVAGLGFALVGFGVSCVVPLVFAMAGRSAALSSGSAIAGVSTVGYFGFLIVPPLVGFVAQAAGLRWAFALMATLGVLLMALVSKLPTDTPAAPSAAADMLLPE
ncbi:MFS transporter [Hymenobacter busanensis]|uniref:MFS transporter n=1 Tax=Hymenobacter busanensis TaxID=2607656 RepID=A0A7L4ZZ47_9BACT|nr:MFS transporter [Hymenobacter busanensis]KAA9333268.1 MFS transporter [Hymenobacter busanensis]QHJ08055.1 MFS transporter [Hymenobacter busanensis]